MIDKEAQAKLISLGLLDPPADGLWGKMSAMALQMFQQANKLEPTGLLTNSTKEALTLAQVPKLTPSNTLGFTVARYMLKAGMFVAQGKGLLNIAYLEGVSLDGTLNDDSANEWNDLRIVFEVIDGQVTERGRWAATTEPGWYWTAKRRGNPKGAARIAFGQYKAWRVGIHRNSHQALVQTGGTVTVHRDYNCDGVRTADKLDTGYFGINQHWGWDMKKVDKASAGCLVGQSRDGHRNFMTLVKTDKRYQVNSQYSFFTAVLAGDKALR
jgi:hypothetical protein